MAAQMPAMPPPITSTELTYSRVLLLCFAILLSLQSLTDILNLYHQLYYAVVLWFFAMILKAIVLTAGVNVATIKGKLDSHHD